MASSKVEADMRIADLRMIVIIGVGATFLLDGWLSVLRGLGVKTLDTSLIGRWVGHSLQGRLFHTSIAKSRPIRGEWILGWFTHYAIGVAFAAMLIAVQGTAWLQRPALVPALVIGASTVIAPLFVMQPAMGAGIAASKTPTPLKNCLRSIVNHTVFGAGLYLSAIIINWF
jgi:hypothetical protein